MSVHWALDIMVNHNSIGEHNLEKWFNSALTWYCTVGNTTYDGPGCVGNSFYMPIGRYEWNQQLVTWLFTEPWIIWYPHTRFLERCLKKYQTTAQNNVYRCLDKIWDLRRCCKTFILSIVRLEWGENLVPWLYIEPWTLRYLRIGFGSIHSKSS